jgi:APA family basic amino acid/polyamine antiporter
MTAGLPIETAPSTATPPVTRSIGLIQATAMVVGTIVGASIFVQPSEVSREVPSLGGMLLVWIAAGVLTCGNAAKLLKL